MNTLSAAVVSRQQTHCASARGAFTLPELVVSVAVAGLIVASLGSALSIAARSIRPDATAATSLDVARCMITLQNDLQFASRVLDRSSRSIKVLTTDADATGGPDIVEYSWTGVTSTPLLRSVNGSTAVPVCDAVTDFSLTLTTDDRTLITPEPPVAGGEQLLDEQVSLSNTSTVTVGWDDAYAQYVHPTLFTNPQLLTGNDEWQITRVEYYGRRTEDDDGAYEFEIDRATADGLPTHEQLVSIDLDPAEVSDSGEWISHTLTGLPWLSAFDGVSIKLTYLWGWNRLELRRTAIGTGSGYQTTDGSSTDWFRPSSNRSLLFRVYGRVRSRLHADQSEPDRRFTSAAIRLETATLKGGPLQTAVELVNRPPDATVLAVTDFSTFSLTSDSNYDGIADWTVSNISSSNSSTVAGGKWTAANKTLLLAPAIPAGRIVDTHVVGRCRTTTGTLVVKSAVRQANSTLSVSAMAYLTLTSGGTQTLSLYEETGTSQFALRGQFTLLASTQQDLRMVLNPAECTVAVWINDVLMDTLHLGLIASPGVPARVQIQAWGNNSEFDFCGVVTRATTGFGVGTP